MSKANKKAINGILLLNKPKGLTSNHALQKVKRLYNAKKAGHTGSLDPLATGMLPICFGEATKFSQYLLNADKTYDVTAQLGIKTNTADATGEIIARIEQFQVSHAALLDVLEQFKGTIHQTPSMFSALKHQGTPLYKYARAGVEIERQAREICIQSLSLNAFDGEVFELTVQCSKGTYIRNLVEDIGDELGVGAHVTQLHRTAITGFRGDTMYCLDDLFEFSDNALQDCLLSIDHAIDFMPSINIDQDEVSALRQGKVLLYDNPSAATHLVRMYDKMGIFVGLGQLDTHNKLKVQRLVMY